MRRVTSEEGGQLGLGFFRTGLTVVIAAQRRAA